MKKAVLKAVLYLDLIPLTLECNKKWILTLTEKYLLMSFFHR